MLEGIVNRIIEETTEIIEIGIGQEKDHSQEITITAVIGAQAIVDSRSGSRANTNRDRIRCYTCREYDHFPRDCPNSREERNLQQLQQMLNMEEQGHRVESSDEDYRSTLNL